MTNIENTNEVKTIFPIRYFCSKNKLFDKEECFSSQNDKIYRTQYTLPNSYIADAIVFGPEP